MCAREKWRCAGADGPQMVRASVHVVASKINAASREGMVWPNKKRSVRCVWKATEEASKTDGFGLITRGEIALGDRLRKGGGG